MRTVLSGGGCNLNSEEEQKKVIKLMEEGCKDYLVQAQRLVKEVGERDFRKDCMLQIFIDVNGNVVFGRRVS